MERGAAGAPNGAEDDDAGTDVAGKLAPPFLKMRRAWMRERCELAALNVRADAAVSYETRRAISPTTELHPGVGANT
jgi:hypothetical protein